MKRLFAAFLALALVRMPVSAEPIRWVDFGVPAESMAYALHWDVETFEEENHRSWIAILALAACRTGGKCPLASVKRAAKDLEGEGLPKEAAGELGKYYDYYFEAFSAALGGLVGSYAIEKDGQWIPQYGLKAFSPIAKGFDYSD